MSTFMSHAMLSQWLTICASKSRNVYIISVVIFEGHRLVRVHIKICISHTPFVVETITKIV